MSYSIRPNPIPTNEPFELDLFLQRDNRPVEGARLAVDAAMPQHRHGMNTQPVVTATSPGRFHVSGMQFHMPGRWELYFDITEGAVTERAQFEVNLE